MSERRVGLDPSCIGTANVLKAQACNVCGPDFLPWYTGNTAVSRGAGNTAVTQLYDLSKARLF